MKIKCEKAVFSEAASVVGRAVSSRSPLPVLEGILIRAKDGYVKLFGYDLDIGISTSFPAQLEGEGEIVLPSKVLQDIMRKLPGETVTLSVGEKCLTEIKSGVSEFTILGMASDEFPEFPDLGDADELDIPQNMLKSMIDQTSFAISQSDAKPVHTGSLFDISDDILTMVSVDGYRLALRREKVGYPRDISFVVPGKALAEASKILKEDSDELATLRLSKKNVAIDVGRFTITSQLLEGDFLDYKNAIPKGGDIEVRVNTRELIEAVERVSLIISDRIKSPLRLKFIDNELTLSCSTALGRAIDSIPVRLSGGPVEMGFNNRYLLEALRASQSDEVKFVITGPLSPMKLLPADAGHFTFLVLPVRLKTEV